MDYSIVNAVMKDGLGNMAGFCAVSPSLVLRLRWGESNLLIGWFEHYFS
ncbi:hypothetical protein [Paenibacillus sp. JNUCC31]|nr:hypothetical protein [Paenibacillus sp. JNUCC-31]